MLVFNPNKRPTIDELLADPYFNDVRKEVDKTPCPGLVNFPFEKKAWIPMAEIRQMALQEIDYYKGLDDSRFERIQQKQTDSPEDLKIKGFH